MIAFYLRYSSAKQSEGFSIELQRQACLRALPPGADPAAVIEYIDEARSGCTIAGRTALLRLMQDGGMGKIETLIVYKFDRLGRNQAETATVIQDLEDAGVKVTSATEGADPLARGMHLVISEHYIRQLSERTRDGVREAARKGHVGGPAPFGYTRANQVLTVNPQTAPVVRRIFTEYAHTGYSLKAIVHRLNADHCPSPRGGEWLSTTLHEILSNEIYTGRIVFSRRRFRRDRRTGRRLYKMTPRENWVIEEKPELAIIPRDLFERVQEMRKIRSRQNGEGRRVYPLSGVVVCAVCGRAYVAQRSRNEKGTYVYMVCGNRGTGGHCTNRFRFRQDLVLDQLLQRTADELLSDAAVTELKAILLRQAADRLQSHAREHEAVARALTERRQRVRSVVDLMIAAKARGDGTEGVWADELAKLTREIKEQEGAYNGLNRAISFDSSRIERWVDEAVELQRRQLAPAANPLTIREALRQMLGKIAAHPDGRLVFETQPAGILGGIPAGFVSIGSGGGLLRW